MKRDSTLENVFIWKILDNTMPDSILMEPEITNLHFANRKIELDLECHWEGAHNIQCPKQGQMSWAEFRTKDRARRFLYKRIQLTKSKDGSLLEEEKIKVIFQGVETIATKMIIKINISEAIMGGSNKLVIYNLCLLYTSDAADE